MNQYYYNLLIKQTNMWSAFESNTDTPDKNKDTQHIEEEDDDFGTFEGAGWAQAAWDNPTAADNDPNG